eukprot:CAMPEP_0180321414 /NCGR_PEP_ID=MMETSP0988-20121125/36128_1 /TAXON_ID=697907 /ORGANISM="non described non described, Strain CCMP2293" /LENGTH=51 /DNA_ID=CAMNT_0022307275 /DNA_START=18 /DNA_END=170 /DNA_ORIENTATION=-
MSPTRLYPGFSSGRQMRILSGCAPQADGAVYVSSKVSEREGDARLFSIERR